MKREHQHEPDAKGSDRLARLAAHGELIVGGANRPIRLSDPDVGWFVERGAVDVFSAHLSDAGVLTDFKHVLRANAGRLLFPVAEDATGSVLVAKGLPDSAVQRTPIEVLAGAGANEQVARQVDAWVSDFSQAVARDITYRPRIDRLLADDSAETLEGAETLSVRRGVVWVSIDDGSLAYMSTEEPEPAGSGLVPVTAASWVDVRRLSRVRCVSSHELQREGRLLAALAEFNRLALRADNLNRRLLFADVANLQTAGARFRHKSEEGARRSLFGVLDQRRMEAEEGLKLPGALKYIGSHEGITFRMPQDWLLRRASAEEGPSLQEILLVSGVHIRRVSLRTEQRWWLGDSGAMLAMRRRDGASVALIPGPLGRYRMIDPESGRSRQVDARRAASLEGDACFFYSPLPHDRPADARQLLRLALHRVTGDLAWLLGAGLLAGLATLVPAALLGVFAEQVLPAGSLRILGTVTVAAVLAALTFGILRMLQNTALMRVEGRGAARMGAALWDRIVDLPSHFFRRFTAGDLATRAMAFNELRDQVSGIVAGALLSVVFLLPTFVVLFLYNATLGWLCLGLGLASLGTTLGLGLLQVPYHRQRLVVTRKLAGVLLQLIGGVGKLRTTGSEAAAFTMWAEGYRDQKQAEMRIGAYNEHLVAFTAAAPIFATAALFMVGAGMGENGLPVGSFLAIYAAFMVFYGAVSQLGFVFSALAAILPAAEQVAPILAEPRRNISVGLATPKLKGEVHLDHVTFRYSDAGPLVLQDVSIHARPGEFIALVGASGSGKSTIFRLALGLEKPLSGAVYYDGQDLEQLNGTRVRNRIGVVVQDAPLRPQTVLDNIIGIDGDLTVDDAWRAARLASVDSDIAAMPMGMFTVTSASSGVFSGGQTQRIILAGALARNPSILLLDEATNALDNRTQAIVMAQIEKLSVTRIVSAHRLSTIRKADRIYVLQQGRIVQQGTFAALMEEEGIFRALASRQLT